MDDVIFLKTTTTFADNGSDRTGRTWHADETAAASRV